VEIEVTCRPHVGWVADYGDFDTGSRGRLDLRGALLDLNDGRPEVPVDQVSVEDLAGVLGWNVEIDLADPSTDTESHWLSVAPHLHRTLRRVAPTPRYGNWAWEIQAKGHDYLAPWAERWLRWCGFTQARAMGEGRRASVEDPWLEVTLHTAASQVGLGVVQRAHAKAALSGRRAVVISETHASRPAIRWSESAGVLLIQADRGLPRPLNSVAAAYLPRVNLLPEHCDSRSCQAFGCCADSEMVCPDDVGTHWDRLPAANAGYPL
jgi:hypothetical protein